MLRIRSIHMTLLVFLIPVLASAQMDRAQTWEWSIAALYQNSKGIGGGGGSSLDLNAEWGIGFNVGYNFSGNLTVGADFDFLRPDYRLVLVDDTVVPAATTVIDHNFSQFNGRLKGTYSFLDGPFNPFIEAGLGWSYFDSNVADGPPITGCWWHPWWGYICSNFYSTFTETSFTWGGGVGFRYQLRGGSFIKLSYNVWDLDSLGEASDSTIAGGRLEFGWGF